MSTAGNPLAPRLLHWFDHHGRKHLPWQTPRTPYRVWLSEIMLQQTQVATVVGYFERFVAALPDLSALAAAPQDQVLGLWSGLGYYSRARNLHKAAKLCMSRHDGELPQDLDALAALPGIGRSTAGAIMAQAWGLRCAILDGNVKRVLSRYHGVEGWPGSTATARTLWQHAETNTPQQRVADYTQAIMDLGATVCVRSRPRCGVCPLRDDCVALRDNLTTQLPQRKPAKAVPTRQTCLLILRDDSGRVLLQRRPASGVWAELWSLPEAADSTEALRVAQNLGAASENLRALTPFTHVFSHYRLDITPLLATTRPLPRVADRDDLRWCGRADYVDLGLPAPVRRLLLALPD
ncbi:A/G-specific DNA-adenine glycosylase [Tahibacter aquaticus]|uniref:Adenine DNA glycosylase n=1 Tax=Tahibacter aquaticus TaxID=520092 RepID=A0A4R6YR33_9GAMM|nr:A/G-specific adenine glycosylase [Tahibacter aquaticus]TDR40461.1 A/G-specific DNA-adenine glycosylase [Tahibacter aquaticus]